jgi:regulator of replication initiation timing
MNMIQVMAGELADMRDEVARLKRENSILRSELKERLVSEWIVNYDMSEEATEQAAEQYIVHAIAHNEGAE